MVLIFTLSGSKMPNFRSIDFPGGSELTRTPKGPIKGAKMTVMDVLEYRYINRQDSYTEIWFK